MTAQIQAEALLLAINLKDPRIIFTLADRTIVAAELCRLLDRIAELEALQAAPPAPAAVAVPEALRELIEAIEFTPLGVRAILAMTRARAALAAAPAQAAAVPSGFVLVPVEPTPEMCRAANGSSTNRQRWADMLAAAPAQEHATQLAGQGQPVVP